MNTKTLFTLMFAASLLTTCFLTGCSKDSDYDFEQSIATAQDDFDETVLPTANFDPSTGDIPATNDFLFSGTTDGTLNIPINSSDSEGTQALKATLNTLDGFSTTAPITARFGDEINPSTAALGSSVRVFELTKTGSMITGIANEVTSSQMAVSVAGASTLVLLPTSPLKPKTGYLVVLTNSIASTDGKPFAPSTIYNLAKEGNSFTQAPFNALEPVRQAIHGYETLAAGAGIASEDIILSWSFTTQSVFDVLADLYNDDTTGTFLAVPTGITTKALLDPNGTNPAIVGNADVYIGTLDVPYFSAVATGPQDTAPLTEYWTGAGGSNLTQFNTGPSARVDLTIPVLITVPNTSAAPVDGWPVVIFQHGITQNRTNSLAVAEALSQANFMTVSIDLALHGITDITNPLHANNTPFMDTEQTFALDLVTNATGAEGPDGTVDDSGTHFINLSSLLTSRDNIRQSVSNLFVLTNSLGNLAAASPAPVPVIDTDNIRFVGHSLGAIVGTSYLAMETQVSSATLAMPGGGIAQLLNNSATFGPRIKAGLEANGIVQGTPEFDAFFAAAQWSLDSADPINFGAAAAENHAIHMIEVVGEGSSLPDQVIPNAVATAPLSGTEPLARIMGLADITETTTGADIDGIVRFIVGDHSSILSPASSLPATIEMQTQIASFAASNGMALPIANNSVIRQ
jgi:pimeloyl-ACP methyl ester carboxylesterase